MTAATARRRASESGPVEPRSGPRFGVRQLGRGRLASWPALRLSGGRIGRFVLVIERRGFEAPPHRQLRPDPRTPWLRGPQAGNGSTAPIAVEPGTPGAPRHVPSHVDESQRLPMYIVISKPKRISVNSGLVHMFPSSGTMGCIGSSRRCHMYRRPFRSNYRATLALSVPEPVAAQSFNGLAVPRTIPGRVCPARFRQSS